MDRNRHWLRALPHIERDFIASFLEPIERLYAEEDRLAGRLLAAETAASEEARRRYSLSDIRAASEASNAQRPARSAA